jgi:hypothetical protein
MRRYQKFNRFFDSVSIRYLFDSGERHEVKPEYEKFRNAKVTELNSHETGAQAGVSGSASSAITPSLEVHVQSNRSVTVEGDMASWRRGVSVESCE